LKEKKLADIMKEFPNLIDNNLLRFVGASTAFHKFHDYATFLFVARGLPV
jgi:hypothetical protein